ncbi:MAG: PKD domain-containing protein [Bacteroidales bacterium]|nr:PKD domain-containing protein [Bacteroidales bacterium]
MRNLIFSLMLSVFSLVAFSQTYEVSVSGEVTDMSGEPVEGQAVDIMTDSTGGDFYYFNTVFTDDDGHYEDEFDVPDGDSGTLTVSTMSCGSYLSESDEFSEENDELEFNFVVCTDMGGDCEAMFSHHTTPNDFMTVIFTDMSIGNPTEWDWDFGDGESSDEQNPTHTYGEEGMYYVSLSIESDSGDCESEIEMMIMVGYDSIYECDAWFFYYPGDLPLSLQFMDESWGDPTSWAWDFGDGNTSDEENPLHIYAAEGEYLVTLTINSDSCTSTYQEMVWADSSGFPGDCEAMYFYYPVCDSGNDRDGDLKYQFIDISYGEPDAWAWDFGDGETSDEQNPIHEFEEEGEYEVCLTISNVNDSCESTYCDMVYVSHDTIGDCTGWFDYDEGDSLTVEFEGFLMNSMNATFSWEFGDSTTGSGQTVLHTYAQDGIYTVTMFAVDSAMGCDIEYTQMVWVGDSITFTVYGNVFLDDSMSADVADVYLMTFDTIGNDLIDVATTSVDSNGYYQFDNVGLENCIYFVQAELTDGSDHYGDYVPTYHVDALTWEDSWPVFPFPMGWSYDIYLQPSQGINAGDGSIAGTVSGEAKRELMPNVEILLLNQDNTPISYLRTDENGEFAFPELEFGTYIVYTEIVGIKTTPVTVVLGESNPDAQLDIVVANGEALLGLGEVSSKYIDEVSAVYPNPVTANTAVEVGMKETGDVQLSVLNQFGQLVFALEKQLTSGSNRIELKTQSLSPGLYIVRIKANDGVATVRKFVKLR